MRLSIPSLLLVLFACLVLVAPATAQSYNVTVILPDANTCAAILPLEVLQGSGTSLKVRSDQTEELAKYMAISGWFMGYFTAVNTHDPTSNRNVTSGMKQRDIMNWLFSYCRNNPRGSFLDAVSALNKALGR